MICWAAIASNSREGCVIQGSPTKPEDAQT